MDAIKQLVPCADSDFLALEEKYGRKWANSIIENIFEFCITEERGGKFNFSLDDVAVEMVLPCKRCYGYGEDYYIECFVDLLIGGADFEVSLASGAHFSNIGSFEACAANNEKAAETQSAPEFKELKTGRDHSEVEILRQLGVDWVPGFRNRMSNTEQSANNRANVA